MANLYTFEIERKKKNSKSKKKNKTKIVVVKPTVAEAENAIASQSISNVAQYWLASFVNTETNEPSILAYIDV